MNLQEYNHCVTNYSDAVYRFIVKQMKDQEEAKNVVQDSFEILWIKRDSVEPDTAKSYLFTVAYNKMIDVLRKTKRMSSLGVNETGAIVNPAKEYELREVLDKALSQLPDLQKSIVLLRDLEGYSYKEIGEILSLNPAQVKVYLFRARTALRSLITKMEDHHGNK
jgi:RNA polymerase sigma factor (sigma-70 family)